MIVVQYIKCKVPIDPINRIHTVTFHWISVLLLTYYYANLKIQMIVNTD